MNVPEQLRYTKSHEWVRLESDGSVTVGITDHAQELLGDMVFVENPEVGRRVNANEECAVVESVKAASDVYAPVAGEVIAVNAEVETSPEKINREPYDAWMFRMHPVSTGDVAALLDAAAYRAHVEAESH